MWWHWRCTGAGGLCEFDGMDRFAVHRLLVLLLLLCTILCATERVGTIEFYGYEGFDLGQLRKIIPAKEGDDLPGFVEDIREALKSGQ